VLQSHPEPETLGSGSSSCWFFLFCVAPTRRSP